MKVKALTTHVYHNQTRKPGDVYELQYKHHFSLLHALGRITKLDGDADKKAPTKKAPTAKPASKKAPTKSSGKAAKKTKAKTDKVPNEKGTYKTRDMKAE